jgi:hypothetical protein
MDRKFVQILADVDCDWQGLTPIYRLFVNDELFAERTWRWTDHTLEEIIQIWAEPGTYQLRWELVQPTLSRMSVTNLRVAEGRAKIGKNHKVTIL